ncbi:MAG: ribonuclease [Clostridia bacterium]|nr:ribonuclease [Clostridia bacterium]
MKKRFFAFIIAFIFIFALSACKKKDEKTVISSDVPVSSSVSHDPSSAVPEGPVPASEPSSEPVSSEPVPVSEPEPSSSLSEQSDPLPSIDEDGYYYSAEDVSLYIHTYGKLPSNFITKKEARALGWSSGSVERYMEGGAIGGDRFGNYEGQLPKGHTYYECDINTRGKKSRGAERIIFSEDGLIYYTADHYKSFTLLYGGDF